jgi:hypothetical protein
LPAGALLRPEPESVHALIEPSALRAAPLPPLKPMEQSRRGAPHLLEAQMRPLVVAILRFTQPSLSLPLFRVGATVQLAIAPSELLKAMFVMVEPMIAIWSTPVAFVKTVGKIAVRGGSRTGGSGAPADSGYTKIYSTASAFAALKADGTITAWGHLHLHNLRPPTP